MREGMKKIVFGLFILGVFLGSLVFAPVALTANFNSVANVDYVLPYPGILPDNPLYFLKVARDNFVSFLVTNPVKKSFYYLLLADKRLASGKVLIETGKIDLGVTTIVSGEKYLSKAVDQFAVTNKNDAGYDDLKAKLRIASEKHLQVMEQLSARTSGDNLNRINAAIGEAQKDYSRVAEVL